MMHHPHARLTTLFHAMACVGRVLSRRDKHAKTKIDSPLWYTSWGIRLVADTLGGYAAELETVTGP